MSYSNYDYTMDYGKYDYTPDAKFPNIVISNEKGTPTDRWLSLDSTPALLLEAICAIAHKYPSHKFVGMSRYYSTVEIDKFCVFAGDDCVGAITTHRTYARGKSIMLHSSRIGNGRDGKYSAQVPKVVKMFGQYFGRVIPVERIGKARLSSLYALNSSRGRARNTMNFTYKGITEVMMDYLVKKLQTDPAFYNEAVALGVDREALDTMADKVTAYKELDSICNAFNTDGVSVVVVDADTYIVGEPSDSHNSKTVVYDRRSGSADIPEYIKTGVGMLKLVEDDQLITNVGYRNSESSFLVWKPA